MEEELKAARDGPPVLNKVRWENIVQTYQFWGEELGGYEIDAHVDAMDVCEMLCGWLETARAKMRIMEDQNLNDRQNLELMKQLAEKNHENHEDSVFNQEHVSG